MTFYFIVFTQIFVDPSVSKVSRKVANLTERKTPHTPVYGVKEFSVILS